MTFDRNADAPISNTGLGLSRVRKQYHFRASPRGLLAWDVDRLVDLAKDLPHQRVPLSHSREIDEPYGGPTRERKRCPVAMLSSVLAACSIATLSIGSSSRPTAV